MVSASASILCIFHNKCDGLTFNQYRIPVLEKLCDLFCYDLYCIQVNR